MFCPNCGAQLPEGSRFCGSCGASLTETPPRSAPNPQEPYPRRKGPPVFLLMVLGVLAAGFCAAGYLLHLRALEKDPLHGAKLREETVWTSNGMSVSVTGLRYDPENTEYPYGIDLAVSGGSASSLRCAAAINGVRVDTEITSRGIGLSQRSIAYRVGLDRFADIDLVLGNAAACSQVIRLHTGLKRPEVHLNTRGDELCSENGCRVLYSSIYPMYRETGPGLEFYMENTTSSAIVLQAKDVAVRGVPVPARMDCAYPPNTVGFAVMEMDTAELEQRGVLPMRDVSMTLLFIDFATQRTLAEIPVSIPAL